MFCIPAAFSTHTRKLFVALRSTNEQSLLRLKSLLAVQHAVRDEMPPEPALICITHKQADSQDLFAKRDILVLSGPKEGEGATLYAVVHAAAGRAVAETRRG